MNFELILPRKIIFGQGSTAQIGEQLLKLGGNRVLVVTSKGMMKRESLRQITGYLQEHKLNVAIFSDVNPEPPMQSVHDCIVSAQENQCDSIIGLGGGSVMDVAKKAAADLGLPKIMVPTTAGTGSEVTHESVLKVNGKKKAFVDEKLIPDVAIVDPYLTKPMPSSLTVGSGIDALAHAVECYQSRRSNPLVKNLALQALQLLRENIQKAVQGYEEARINMSLGSLISGMAFGNSGTTLAHALSYPLSNRGVPHSGAVAMVLPYALEFNGSDLVSIQELREIVKIMRLKWNVDWDIEEVTKEVMDDERHLANNPCAVTSGDVIRIFEKVKEAFSEKQIA